MKMAGVELADQEDTMRLDVAGVALAFSLVAVPALADDAASSTRNCHTFTASPPAAIGLPRDLGFPSPH
jgi:hypothetical protein